MANNIYARPAISSQENAHQAAARRGEHLPKMKLSLGAAYAQSNNVRNVFFSACAGRRLRGMVLAIVCFRRRRLLARHGIYQPASSSTRYSAGGSKLCV